MASTAYVPELTFAEGHSDAINVLAFSSDGSYLASGSDDETVIIWKTLKGTFLYRITMRSKVDSLIWHPLREGTVIVGCENGTVSQVHNLSVMSSETHPINLGVKSHIYCMDYAPTTQLLAAAVGPHVYLTRETTPNTYAGIVMLPNPPVDAVATEESRERPVALKFDSTGTNLVVTHMTRGVFCCDVETQNILWHIKPPGTYPTMAYSAISQNFRRIAVHNFKDGVHLYAMGANGSPRPRLCKFEAEPRYLLALQVAFIHNGDAVVCGSSTGNVCIWQTSTGELYQTLTHPGQSTSLHDNDRP
ncbi:WD40-repeat-containing domain protein [Rhodofomes roseus]|uniref:WD40-repeat-containing domain protein n=1 Tax=Rhodofomes roseus TaxID=34475 RepID=A0ABQ8KVB4_9APHY|nr:WD40-repeat-containing domain protein [Rhodofomes roseus]KAH9842021.1 WD40-repeat-containing domain protein [Rhodofomes roseus]